MAVTPKYQCEQFENIATKILTEALGGPEVVPNCDRQIMRWHTTHHPTGLPVQIQVFYNSLIGQELRSMSWLAARLRLPESWLDEYGYVLPKEDLPGGALWPDAYSYPSGKCNLTLAQGWTNEAMAQVLKGHLRILERRDQ